MSAHLTIKVSEKAAKGYIIRKVIKLGSLDTQRILDIFLEDALYNSQIVTDEEAEDDDILNNK